MNAAERFEVDYPGEGETVYDETIAFEIEAPQRDVAISVDGEGWSSCRRSGERWLYDWTCREPGHHQAVVMCEGPRGAEPTLRVCRFRVEPKRRPAHGA
jgi:hypothetical protein